MKDRLSTAWHFRTNKWVHEEREEIAPIITQVLTAVTLVIVQTCAVAELTRNMTNNLYVNGLRRNDSLLNNRLEKLEQDTCKDQIDIFGIKYDSAPGSEDTNSVVVDLQKMGMECTPADICISHCLPSRGGKPPPIICKFISRNARKQVMGRGKTWRKWRVWTCNHGG